ncbi:MAG: restriction endonuclease [Nanoarchaeota archaeon]|nr:restriction endonuclease [Nanoarchaeota archaeon]
MNEQEKYIGDLENTIRQFMKPLKNIPYKIAIKAVSGYRVIPFDKNDAKNKELLELLSKAAKIATKKANENGVFANRVNEIGNHMEPFVSDALNYAGLKADKPTTKEGKKKATGYPDIFLTDKYGRPVYIECKTYNEKNYQSSQRSFYFSPAERQEDFKITQEAMHLVISFRMEKAERNGKDAYIPVHWKIFSIDNLIGQIKHEFNASNRQMYAEDALLVEGSF